MRSEEGGKEKENAKEDEQREVERGSLGERAG
jgi:hypothetical protein